MPKPVATVLVFRVGSIGDFVIALPCLKLVRKVYPTAEIGLLANEPVEPRAVPARVVLEGTGLIDRFFTYPPGTRDLSNLRALRQSVRAFAPSVLIYLAPPRGSLSVYRDYLFFKSCGIHEIFGLPWRARSRRLQPSSPGSALWEREAERLARGLASLGIIDFDDAENWHLPLSMEELAEGQKIVRSAMPADSAGRTRFLALSIGTKQQVNDWGDENWSAVLNALNPLGIGLILIGGPEDSERSQYLATAWAGPTLNLCGTVSPRISAAVMRAAVLLLCHDSGPMHLAAAVGTSCVAVFSRLNQPGQWFPLGRNHTNLYPWSKTGSIQSIRPPQVVAATVAALAKEEAVSMTLLRQLSRSPN